MPRKSKFDDLMEAITFAEAGETETASRIASDLFPAAARQERILVVGGASGFSREMIENSIGLAERLEFGIIALSVSPALLKMAAKLGVRERENSVGRSAEIFRANAAERGILFVHTARTGDPEKVVADVQRTFHRIAFLVIEPELASRARFAGVNVPIFYLAGA